VARFKKVFFAKLIAMPKSFFDCTKSGWLVARNTGDMQHVFYFITFAVMIFLVFFTAMAMALYKLINIHPILLAPCIITVPLILFMTRQYETKMTKAQRSARKRNSEMVANLTENIKGVRVVQAFDRQEQNMRQFSTLNMINHDIELRISRLTGLFLPTLDFAGILNTTLAITLGLMIMKSGLPLFASISLTTGDLVAFIMYLNTILWPMRMVMDFLTMSMAAMAAGERLFEIIDLPIDLKNTDKPVSIKKLKGRIELSKVSFRYNENSDDVLKDVDFTIEPGRTIALVGETGAGKTTIASLIARFYDVTGGSILIDDIDVRSYNLNDLHFHMGVIQQEGYLFSGTVMDNLKFGSPDMPDVMVYDLVKRLGTHDFIEKLPDSYQTVVMEGGQSLSLGQRQIIALTRAIIADPAILIMDEPTSSLDVRSEHIIQGALKVLTKDRTTIIIAHRLSTVKHADEILVIGEQGIVEHGSHSDLLSKKGRYYQLVETMERATQEN
jgi:ABC-type multidrug transport system fused ATPase/permease subunit